MTKTQERTLSMLLLVTSFLKKNTPITATIPQFTPNFNTLEATVDEIRDIEQQQTVQSTTTNAKNKKDLRMQCFVELRMVHDVLLAYSVGVNNDALAQQVSTSISRYTTIADTTFATACEQYYNIANPLAADLEPYGVDAAYLAAFRANIDMYLSMISAPRENIISRAESTKLLVTLFTKAKKDLDRLTKLVTIKRLSEPSFYNKYLESIKIIDSGSTKMAMRVALKDQDGLGGRNFVFTFVRLSDNKAFEYKTNDNGTIVRQFFKDGEYTVTVTKLGYTAMTTNILIQENETYKMEVNVNTIDKTIGV
jgi:hypothetical protein